MCALSLLFTHSLFSARFSLARCFSAYLPQSPSRLLLAERRPLLRPTQCQTKHPRRPCQTRPWHKLRPNVKPSTHVDLGIVTGNPGVTLGLPRPRPDKNPYLRSGYGFYRVGVRVCRVKWVRKPLRVGPTGGLLSICESRCKTMYMNEKANDLVNLLLDNRTLLYLCMSTSSGASRSPLVHVLAAPALIVTDSFNVSTSRPRPPAHSHLCPLLHRYHRHHHLERSESKHEA